MTWLFFDNTIDSKPNYERALGPHILLFLLIGISKFRLNISKFRHNKSKFRLNNSKFRLNILKFRLIISKFRHKISTFRLIISKFRLNISKFRHNKSKIRHNNSKFRLNNSKFRLNILKFRLNNSKFRIKISRYFDLMSWNFDIISKFRRKISKFWLLMSKFRHNKSKIRHNNSKFRLNNSKFRLNNSKFWLDILKYRLIILKFRHKISWIESTPGNLVRGSRWLHTQNLYASFRPWLTRHPNVNKRIHSPDSLFFSKFHRHILNKSAVGASGLGIRRPRGFKAQQIWKRETACSCYPTKVCVDKIPSLICIHIETRLDICMQWQMTRNPFETSKIYKKKTRKVFVEHGCPRFGVYKTVQTLPN